jgi:murein DD-endopeptidase MepM/ murein hydrolase activator NlpD
MFMHFSLKVLISILLLGQCSVACAFESKLYRFKQKKKAGIKREFLMALETTSSGYVLHSPIMVSPELNTELNNFTFSFLSEKSSCPITWELRSEDQMKWKCNQDEFVLEKISEPPPSIDLVNPTVPFHPKDKARLKSRLRAVFGDPRNSYNRGHMHSGIDIQMSFEEKIFSIGNGLVVFASNVPKDATIVVEHTMGSKKIYSKYVHLGTVLSKAGDLVTADSILGYAFTKKQFSDSKFPYNHLHLEIRSDFNDAGLLSSRAKTLSDLRKNHMDPLPFLLGEKQ